MTSVILDAHQSSRGDDVAKLATKVAVSIPSGLLSGAEMS